jgi:hypothetical protein
MKSSLTQKSRVRLAALAFAAIFVCALLAASPAAARHGELPNRIPEAAPYDTQEAKLHPPPYDQYFAGPGNPGVCGTCHKQIFAEWNGSMMSNAWRDPVWRGAFYLITKLTSTDGACSIPNPPDGTAKSKINPFGNEDCTSTFNLGTTQHTMKGPGSLLDGFCSRCHMPANYIDSVKLQNVSIDPASGLEHGLIDPGFNPASPRGTLWAFATNPEGSQNDAAGKVGITCTFCHTAVETRYTPFHNYERSGVEYHQATGKLTRDRGLTANLREMLEPSDASSRNLGYGVGAGAYRVSPEAIVNFERFGPLTTSNHTAEPDTYLSGVFKTNIAFQKGRFDLSPHKGNYAKLYERAEMCATCHDVTNPMTIKNTLGRWVGGFPIERTYSEWSKSRYSDRPGNENFQPAFKRDCQTCHMQQDYGQPGTAQTLYSDGEALPPRSGTLALNAPERPLTFSHHFVGGNTYSTRVIGAAVNSAGKAEPYPELSAFSYSSADENSEYHNAVWENVSDSGPPTQHARFAWDRLRHAVEVKLSAAQLTAKPSTQVPLSVRVENTGTGHDFPTGFPEGRNAWLAVHAIDLDTGKELEIADSFWKRRSLGVGYLTEKDQVDPSFPGCNWRVPAGGPDPYAYQFRAVGSLGNGCPTLDLPYATPLNLVTNADGLPIDKEGKVIGRDNPLGLPQFHDVDGDGDVFDDSFLLDTRLRPMPNREAALSLDRYSVVLPPDVRGPIAVTAAVYYQSMEAVVAKKFMGNMADTDLDHLLEPCVLHGACDGRVPHTEPAVVEGAPPVPARVETVRIDIAGQQDVSAPLVNVYPPPMETNAAPDTVIKFTASEPLKKVDGSLFKLLDSRGQEVAAEVALISDLTWALFPRSVFLTVGERYTAQLGIVCDTQDHCTHSYRTWAFTIASAPDYSKIDTRVPTIPRLELEAALSPLPAPKSDFLVGTLLRSFGALLLAGLALLPLFAIRDLWRIRRGSRARPET